MRLIDFILRIIAYSGLLALLCYLLWRSGVYQASIDNYYSPTKTAHQQLKESTVSRR